MTFPDTRTIIAITMVIGVHALIGALVVMKAEPALVNTAIGIYLGVFGTVGGFYFGSSSGSNKKDDVIAAMVPKAPEPVPPPARLPGL